MREKFPTTLILGRGNTIAGDDGIGIYVARKIKENLPRKYADSVSVLETSKEGPPLLDIMREYDRVIIIDTMSYQRLPPEEIGEVLRIEYPSVKKTGVMKSPHQTNIGGIVELAEKIGLKLPEIKIYCIKIKRAKKFSDEISPVFKKNITKIASEIMNSPGFLTNG
ncbi:MAG: hydrogenase maturation protease [Elusimicrobia bacterium]|nr:hydrogenase maturation protease [Elusimicrobiota bacterium]